MCFLGFPGAGLALDELGSCSTSSVALLVGFGASESELWRVVLLLSEGTVALLSFFFLGLSSSEESSLEGDELEESLESLELESDGGNGVLLAVLRAFLSAFLPVSFPDEEDELEEESSLSLSEDPLSEESDSDESEESDEDSLVLESEDSFAFLDWGASSPESESESDSDSEELDSAFRFTPVDLAAGAALGAASASSSSSASLSELEEALEEELEEDEEEEEDDDREDFLDCLGASPISTSESLDSSELLLLPLSLSLEELEEEDEEAGLAAFFPLVPFVSPSHFWKSSSKDGAFFESVSEVAIDLLVCSLAKALLVLSKPCSDRKEATEAINCAGGDTALLFLLPLVCWPREPIVNTWLSYVHLRGIIHSWYPETSSALP